MAEADNSAALQTMDRLIAVLRRTPETLEAAMPLLADELRRELEEQIQRGEAPDGTPWPQTKEGKQALRNAAAALTVDALGFRVVAQITGPTALHHMGRSRGGIVRQILPSRRMPDALVKALGAVLQRQLYGALSGNG